MGTRVLGKAETATHLGRIQRKNSTDPWYGLDIQVDCEDSCDLELAHQSLLHALGGVTGCNHQNWAGKVTLTPVLGNLIQDVLDLCPGEALCSKNVV